MGISSDTLWGMFRRTRTVTLALGASLAVTALAGCSDDAGDSAASAASVTDVTVTAASDVIQQQGVVVLDVRTPAEYASGHLEDAVNIDLASPTFDDDVAALPVDATYVVYCRSGSRSAVAADRMLELGFTDVYNVTGGVAQWQASGGTLVTS